MKAHFSAYPKIWGLTSTDRNIDHCHVPNLQTYLKRRGWQLKLTHKTANYQPGDLVTCNVAPGTPHIMIVSDRKANGTLLVI